jgi:hypothetical protein
VDRTHRPSASVYSVYSVKSDHFLIAAIISLAVVLAALIVAALVSGGQ